ncbi:hypothetical protein [Ruegeria sp.]|uniref:hypothetical protein n=1 Tax=Ruegeria sp. TaxID=1879320 RepID=UPI003C7DCA9F
MALKYSKPIQGLIGICLGMLPFGDLSAQAIGQPRVHIVQSDFGGRIDRRAARVETLRDKGDRVEIRGRVCLSACTLFLGVRDVCVDTETIFGFHGPSLWGLPLDQNSFEYWSDVVASHYKPALRQWYLEVARYRLNGYHRLSGRQIIALGYAPCEKQI